MGGKLENDVLAVGIKLYGQKKYEDALTFFLSLPPDSGADKMDAAYYLGLCYARLGRYDDALLYLEQVVTSGGNIDRVMQCRFILAVIYALSRRRRLADYELSKLLETGYMTASVYAAIAYVAWEQSDIDKCLQYYEKSLEKDPQNMTSLNGLGYVLASEDRDLARALTLCRQAVKFSPDSAACLDSLGWVYYKLGLFSDAMKCLEKAGKIDSSNEKIAEHIKIVSQAGRG